jgi:hypothetical protein
MSLWSFSTPPAQPRAPEVVLVAFSCGPLTADVPLLQSRFGGPSAAAIEASDVRQVDRAAAPDWFDNWRRGSLRGIASEDLGDALAHLDAADQAHVIISQPDAPADLGYLQAAWTLTRYLAARGATVVADAHAIAYTPASRLQPAAEPLDVSREIRVLFEPESTRPDGVRALHTRGMRKFGAPDLIAHCGSADAGLVARVMAALADAVARGAELTTPSHDVHVGAGVTWAAVEDVHHLADRLHLNNAARVLVDETGRALAGVVARIAGSDLPA